MPTFGLSKARRISWYAGSVVFGLFLFWFIAEKGLLRDPQTARFELAVFVVVWAVVVALLRLVCRDMKEASAPEGE